LTAICPVLTFLALLQRQAAASSSAAAGAADAHGPVAAAIASVDAGLPAGVDGWLPWLVLLWMAGVLFMACRALRQWRVLAHVAHHCAVPSAELESVLAGLASRFRFVRRIRVLVSEHIDTPTLIGWLKPVILLPTAVALGFPRQQIELILAHELGHLRRYDHLVNLAQALLETLLFYHPVVHWISDEVRNERELCCDALVLRLTAGEPREYARTLAALEELRQPSAQVALAANGGVLLDRVRRIVGMPASGLTAVRPNTPLWLLVAAGLVVAVASLSRVGHDEEHVLALPQLTVDWLPKLEARALPMLALTLPRHRPHLELAAVAVPPVPPDAIKPATLRVAEAAAAPVAAAVAASVHIDTAAVALPQHVAANPAAPARVAPASVAAAPLSTAPLLSTASSSAVPRPEATTPVAPHESAAPPKVAVRPTATHIVAPDYPAFVRGARTERVEVSFAIGADGNVRDIAVADGGVDAIFARAAEHALRQWRFDPATVPADRAIRYDQTFVFAPRGSRAAGAGDEQGCVQPTGTHICRRPDDLR
jgi:TonB family protein